MQQTHLAVISQLVACDDFFVACVAILWGNGLLAYRTDIEDVCDAIALARCS